MFDLQLITVLLVVALAAGYMLSRAFGLPGKKKGAGACGHCSSCSQPNPAGSQPARETGFVPLEMLQPAAKRPG